MQANDDIAKEIARLRGVCTLASGDEVRMPPTGTGYEQYMLQCEPQWVAISKMSVATAVMHDPYSDNSTHGEGTMVGTGGHPTVHRAAAAQKLIKNHEAVIRDVCNPQHANVNGKSLTQGHLKRVDPAYVQYVEEALRMVVIKLLGAHVPPDIKLGPHHSGGVAPALTGDPTQSRVWAATCMFVLARMQLGNEKPGRSPDMAPDAALAMRTALMEVGRDAIGL
jgi:hypothetical protein